MFYMNTPYIGSLTARNDKTDFGVSSKTPSLESFMSFQVVKLPISSCFLTALSILVNLAPY